MNPAVLIGAGFVAIGALAAFLMPGQLRRAGQLVPQYEPA
jgi:hypothetical protein